MQENDLAAAVGGKIYNPVAMTDTELWIEVGRALAARRAECGWDSTRAVKRARHDAPHEVTLATIEDGRPGNVQSLTEYCAVLGVRLTDVLRSVLPSADASAEGLQMARAFDAADPQMRKAIRLLLEPSIRPTRRPDARPGSARTTAKSAKRA